MKTPVYRIQNWSNGLITFTFAPSIIFYILKSLKWIHMIISTHAGVNVCVRSKTSGFLKFYSSKLQESWSFDPKTLGFLKFREILGIFFFTPPQNGPNPKFLYIFPRTSPNVLISYPNHILNVLSPFLNLFWCYRHF